METPQNPPSQPEQPKPPKRILTDEQVKEVAQGLLNNKYFISSMIAAGEGTDFLGCVFMPLGLMKIEQLEKLMEEGACIFYEEWSKAGPRSVNGYPIFFTMRYMSEEDYRLVDKFFFKLKETQEALAKLPIE